MLIVKDVMAIQLKCTKMLHANSKQFNLDLMDLKKGDTRLELRMNFDVGGDLSDKLIIQYFTQHSLSRME